MYANYKDTEKHDSIQFMFQHIRVWVNSIHQLTLVIIVTRSSKS